jgi:hypothetical protein
LAAFSEEAFSTAIHAEDAVRDQILESCDHRFYKLHKIEPNLFSFVEAHQSQIQLAKALLAPRRLDPPEFPNVSTLYAHLLCSKSSDYSLESACRLVRDLATEQTIPATEGDRRAFELVPEDTTQCVLHRKWVNQLIAAKQDGLADASTLVSRTPFKFFTANFRTSIWISRCLAFV